MKSGLSDTVADIGRLTLRLGFGGLLLSLHGWGKLMAFGERAASFYDPFGIGSAPSFGLVVFAEVACAAAVALGIFARWAAVPPIVAMAVGAFGRHAADPLERKELALVYLIGFTAILLLGGGRFSLDRWFRRKAKR